MLLAIGAAWRALIPVAKKEADSTRDGFRRPSGLRAVFPEGRQNHARRQPNFFRITRGEPAKVSASTRGEPRVYFYVPESGTPGESFLRRTFGVTVVLGIATCLRIQLVSPHQKQDPIRGPPGGPAGELSWGVPRVPSNLGP